MQPKVTRDDVVAAAERIAGEVERTPLIESEVDGTRIWLKCECLQTGGAFKLRGATNRLLQLSPEERERGVVAFSSGNHARGVAIAARRLGIRAIIVMPADAPQVKVDGTRAEGAEIIFYDRRTESREEIAARIASETGATVVPSFDDPAIVAGQGTVGLEIVEQLGRCARRGSSSLAAAADWRRGSRWRCQTRRSSSSSRRAGTTWRGRSSWARSCRSAADAPNTFCDAHQTPRVSPITFGILRERERAGAVGQRCRSRPKRSASPGSGIGLVVEPGGAVGACRTPGGQACPAGGYGRGAVGREYRSGASCADRRQQLGDVAGLIFAGLDVGRARALDRLGQLFELGGKRLELGGEEAALILGDGFRGVDQRVEHHGDARQDRLLDPLERLVEARLLVGRSAWAAFRRSWLSVGEIGLVNGRIFVDGALALAMIAGFLLARGGREAGAGASDEGPRHPDDRRGPGARHERDDLDGIAGLIGSVASRMSR